MPEGSALRALNGFDVYRILAGLHMQLKENVRKALRKQGFSCIKKETGKNELIPFNPDADAIREYILDEAGEYKERLQ